MRHKYFVSLSIITLALFSCKNLSSTNQISETTNNVDTYGILGVVWQQNSAEYRALCYQAFNTAKSKLEAAIINNSTSSKPLAIITDIDETILDNSPYQATRAINGKPYTSKSWIEWVDQVAAEAVPGAIDFLNYADKNNVTVFYISDRKDRSTAVTLRNLKKAQAPNTTEEFIFLKKKGMNKEVRRQKVVVNYNVVMYLGDNLSDFSEVFDNQKTEKRNNLSDSLKREFGSKFIVLPNPMYGAWQTDGIYESNYNWSPAQKDSILRSSLKKY